MRMTEGELRDLKGRGLKVVGEKPTAQPAPVPKVDRYRSGTEREFAASGYQALMCDLPLGTKLLEIRYESVHLQIDGGIYTPDFTMSTDTCGILFVETKGSRKQKNYAAGRQRLRSAAERYYIYRFFQAMKKRGGGWEFEEVTSNKRMNVLVAGRRRAMREMADRAEEADPFETLTLLDYIDTLERLLAGM